MTRVRGPVSHVRVLGKLQVQRYCSNSACRRADHVREAKESQIIAGYRWRDAHDDDGLLISAECLPRAEVYSLSRAPFAWWNHIEPPI